MKYLALFILLLGQEPVLPATTASTPIEKVEISGVPEQSLSSNLREDLQRLVGQIYDTTIASQFVDRIQTELSQYIAAARTLPGTQPNHVRLVFLVARTSDEIGTLWINNELKTNINAQYTVESVELDGLSKSQLSGALYADMQQMVGQRLDNNQADQLRDRLASELRGEYQILRRVRRGTQSQHVKVVYRGRKIPWLPSRQADGYAVYHSNEGFSGVGNIPLTVNWTTVNFKAANTGDELIERYAGWGVGFESRKLGTERLGIKLDYSSYRAQWSPQTLTALETLNSSDLYRVRRTLEPSVAVAFNRNLYMTAGTSITELEMQSAFDDSRSAHAATGSLTFGKDFEAADSLHRVGASYELRSGTHALDSDFIYTRHLWDVYYALKTDKTASPDNVISIGLQGGFINGAAPLFERFTLGDTRTLRGWNKFDLAPLGGSRMFHGSLGYRFKMLQLFYDAGAVWEKAQAIQVRQSVGFGLRETSSDNSGEAPGRCLEKGDFPGCWFVNVGIPIRNARLEPTISVGIGF
jgi:hypothetical protein